MRYELFVYDSETEELIHNQQAALADLIACLVDSDYEYLPWVIMKKPMEGGSWERYYDRRGGLDIHYKKIMEEE